MKFLEAREFLRSKLGSVSDPEVALVLGSGLVESVQGLRQPLSIPFKEIPGLAQAQVPGHRGTLTAGELEGKRVLVLSGRVHYYEGHSMEQVIFPIRLLSFMGCKKLILTSAVGGMNPKLKPGDVVILKDHINFMGTNPFRGPYDPNFGERFPDMRACYSARLQNLALSVAKKNKIRASPGVYFAVSGPSYETPSEIRAFRLLGGDVVGMSMAPEAMAAHQMGMEVLGLSFVANFSAGLSKSPLRHEDVLEAGRKSGTRISQLISGILKQI